MDQAGTGEFRFSFWRFFLTDFVAFHAMLPAALALLGVGVRAVFPLGPNSLTFPWEPEIAIDGVDVVILTALGAPFLLWRFRFVRRILGQGKLVRGRVTEVTRHTYIILIKYNFRAPNGVLERHVAWTVLGALRANLRRSNKVRVCVADDEGVNVVLPILFCRIVSAAPEADVRQS